MTGTKETRMAAMVLRDKMIEQRLEKRDICILAEQKEPQRIENWILQSWWMEIQCLAENIDKLEKEIIANEFDF